MKQDYPQVSQRNSYAFIKGRIAETLIEELFLSLDYHVYPFGMENTVPEIKNTLRGNRGIVATQIRNMPDFVVQNIAHGDPFFVEVKFRANGKFSYKDLIKKYSSYPYKDVMVVVVSKKHIKALYVEDLEAGEEITPTSKNYFGNLFDLPKEDKDKIVDFCKYATQFFESV